MSTPLPRDTVLKLLDEIMPSLNANFRPMVETYKNLLQAQSRGELPLANLVAALYPGVAPEAAMARFRNNFKKGVNRHLAPRQAELCSQTDNRPIGEKLVWVVSQGYDQQIMDRVTFEAGRMRRDTPSERYIPHAAVTAALPCITFPEQVRRFLDGELQTDAPGLHFCSRVGAKLDPIVQAKPTRPDRHPLVGFELLGLGPHGEAFWDIIKQANMEPVLVKFALAVVAVETASFLLNTARHHPVHNFEHTRFTLNLDREMLLSPLMTRFAERYGDLLRHSLLVEINEDLTLADAGTVLRLVQREKWSVVLDDLNDWDSGARRLFEPLAVWTKLSHKAFQKLAMDIDVARAMRQIKEYVLPGKPLVVEGVEQDEHFRLLVNHWPEEENQPLYMQGFGVKPGAPWDLWLSPLRGFHQKEDVGGYIAISGQLHAETLKILNAHLPEQVVRKMRCQYQQGWVHCTITQERATLRLQLPTQNDGEGGVAPFADQAGTIQIVSRLQEGFDQSRQVTLQQLPDVLDAWHHGERLSRHTLERAADRREHYVTADYVPSGSREGDMENPDARQVLLHWLKEGNRPYCAVLGDYGIGKTFLCREFTREVHRLRAQGEEALPAPVYLDLRDFVCPSGTVPRLEEMMKDLLVRANMPGLAVEGVLAMVRAGHLCVIFDGFDEKSASMSAQDGSSLLREMRRAVPAGSPGKVLIASRTHYFLDRKDEEERIGGGVRQGVTRDGFHNGDFRLVYLLPFDEARILAYLERVFPGDGQGILELFRKIHDLMELSTRPFLLQMIVDSLEHIRKRSRPGIRVTAGDIYAGVVEAWLARDREKMGILHYTIPPAMEAMARFLWGQTGQACHHEMLFRWQIDHARTLFAGLSETAFVALHEKLNVLLRTASFLSRDGKGNYRFAHSSFLEFFLARSLGKALAAGSTECLNLPGLSLESMRFLLDLLQTDDKGRAAVTLTRLLESTYCAGVSENGLRLVLLWQREQADSAPRPQAWQLAGSQLQRIDLSNVEMMGVNFARAYLTEADLSNARIRGNLREADLSRVRAARADLADCDLSGCDLSGADLAGASLVNSRLDGAKLSSTFLQRADLRGSSLVKAQLSATRLAWSHLDPEVLTDLTPSCFSYVAGAPATTLPNFSPHLQTGYGGPVLAVAFNPDGSRIVSANYDRTLKLWDPRSGSCIKTLCGHERSVTAVAFSPDGTQIASASYDHTLKLWDPESASCVRTLCRHEGSVTAMAFSPDGTQIVLASFDGTLKLWDPKSNSCIKTLGRHDKWVNSVAFIPDGTRIVSASDDHTLKLWDSGSGSCIKTLRGHKSQVHAAAFGPDGTWIVSAGLNGDIKLWNPESGSCIKTLRGHEDRVGAIAFSPDGTRIISAGRDSTLRLRDTGSGSCIQTCRGHRGLVSAVAFSPDGRWVVSGGGSIRLWDARSGAERAALWGGEQGGWVATSPKGQILACNEAGLAKVEFVHNDCVYPGTEFAGCFPEAWPPETLQ
ncbi:MAG: pentapeptide repeat-containing protein [Magnetococcus sp. MYC-9]